MRKFGSVEFWDAVWSIVERVSRYWPTWLALGSGGVMAWAAKATALFADYAPFSWVGMGLLGFLMMAASLALVGVMRSRFQLVALRNKVAVADFVDPMAKTFERKRVYIRDLQPPLQGPITNKVFIDCDLIGPANIVFVGCVLNANHARAVDAVIIEDPSGPRRSPQNAYILNACTFTNCTFYTVTFMVPKFLETYFSSLGWGGLNWLTEVSSPGVATQTLPETPLINNPPQTGP